MAGGEANTAASIAQTHLAAEMSSQVGGGVSDIFEIMFGKITFTAGMVGQTTGLGQAGESVMQLMNLVRMLFTISGGLGRMILESIKAYLRGADKRLAGIGGAVGNLMADRIDSMISSPGMSL